MCLSILLTIFSILPYGSILDLTYASAGTYDTYFARIMHDDVYMYRTPLNIDDYSNIYFVLPKTYFVELLDSSNSNFYKVNYLNFTGYVKKEAVQTIAGTPKTPYLKNISFRVYSDLSREIRSEPSDIAGTSSLLTYAAIYSRNFTYYGIAYGSTLIENRTNIWYFCKYTSDKEYTGYVYSDFCDELSPITENTEEVIYSANPSFENTANETTSLPLGNETTGIIIVILSIPAVIFIFMMLKGTKILNRDKEIKSEVKDY